MPESAQRQRQHRGVDDSLTLTELKTKCSYCENLPPTSLNHFYVFFNLTVKH